MKLVWKSGKERQTLSAQERAGRMQFVCLMTVLLMTLVFFMVEDRASGVAYLMVERYLALPAMLFLGASLTNSGRNRGMLYVGLAMVVLFFLNQTTHQVLESDAKEVGTFVCAYALCLPFAAATEDGQRQRGLTWMAGLFLAVGGLLTLYTGLLLLDAVPGYLHDYVYWDGGRLFAMGHPNICATLLMISLGLCAGIALKSRKIWVKAALVVLMALEFGALSLTNGRTTIILTCLLLGGIAFCAVRGRGWKRLVPALLAAVVVMGGLFLGSRAIYSWNQAHLSRSAQPVQSVPTSEAGETPVEPAPVMETTSEPTEQALVADNYQGTLMGDLKTLNGRTEIWRTVRLGLEDNSRVKFIGTEYVEMILSRYAPGPIYHTHNSWLEALYRLGLPGLAAALVLTVLAVWSAVAVLWRNTDLWKSCVALLTVCLLGCAMLEPYLFVADVSYFYLDFLFLMCLGYLWLWRGEKVPTDDKME